MARESSVMGARERGEEMREVMAKVVKQVAVLIQAEILTDDLHRQHFTIREDGLRAALAQSLSSETSVESIVELAKDSYN